VLPNNRTVAVVIYLRQGRYFMKSKILSFVLAATFLLPALAAAEVNGVYLAPRFLLGIQDTGLLSRSGDAKTLFKQHSQAVFGGALAAGFNFAPKYNVPLRTEIEFALRSNSSHSRDGGIGNTNWGSKQVTNLSTLFFNAYFDIETGTPFTPYLGGGLGMAFNYGSIKGNWWDQGQGAGGVFSKNRHETTFAWNLGAGLSYAFTENVAADLGYRFIHTNHRDLKADDGAGHRVKVGSSPYINEFYLGGRFTF
jgi:opacity protein-like surface antigen